MKPAAVDLYRWEDGSLLQWILGARYLKWSEPGTAKQVVFVFAGSPGHRWMVYVGDASFVDFLEDAKTHLRGLALDLGLASAASAISSSKAFLMHTPVGNSLTVPGFLPDDIYDAMISGSSIVHKTDDGREIDMTIFDEKTLRGLGFEGKGDFAKRDFALRLILPERERSSWVKENVLFGTFVTPTPEEVELYRMLGAENPLLWGPAELEEWLQGRD